MLIIPKDVEEAVRALTPEQRRKLSWRDIDDITRPFRERIEELERRIDAARGISHAADDKG